MAIGQMYETGLNPMWGQNIQRSLNKLENEEQYVKMRNLVRQYNDDPSAFTDAEAEKIALVAKTIGLPFTRESKPLKNLMYGAAEGFSMGLAPNSWRPTERGESVYGRSASNKLWSGVGMVGGGLLGLRTGGAILGAAGKGATAMGSRILGGVKGAGTSASQGMAGATQGMKNFYSGTRAGYAGNRPRISAPNANVQVTMGSTSGTHLKFDSGTPSRAATLFARTPTFFLGESGEQFISGSNGKFEISSDNFSLDVDGNGVIGKDEMNNLIGALSDPKHPNFDFKISRDVAAGYML